MRDEFEGKTKGTQKRRDLKKTIDDESEHGELVNEDAPTFDAIYLHSPLTVLSLCQQFPCCLIIYSNIITVKLKYAGIVIGELGN